jgi:glycosyltransferase involved in cell wall biosynthesis/ubiquinone/menaquinone biosynthesis C-methylase UbiE
VYNASKYLEQCLNSVLTQTLQDLEIICVDDGSTDNSLSILESYQKQDSRILILKQKNLHAGIARNNGLEIAKGEYVHFLDADDWVERDTYEHWYQIAKEKNADIAFCFSKLIDTQTGEITEIRRKILKDTYVSESNFTKDPRYFIHASIPPWYKIYRRNFLQNNLLQFDNLLCSNDRFFYFSSILLAKQVLVIQEPWINHRINNKTSLIGAARLKNFDDIFRSFEMVWNLFKDCDDSLKRMILAVSLGDFFWSYRLAKGKKPETVIRNKVRKYLRKMDLSLLQGEAEAEIIKKSWYNEYLSLIATRHKKLIVGNLKGKYMIRMKKLLKKTIKAFLPYGVIVLNRRFRKQKLEKAFNYCPICQHKSHFDTMTNYVVAPRPKALCPYCSSLERHRFLWLFLQKKTNIFNDITKSVLHVAPEPCFRKYFSKNYGANYITADIKNPNVMVKMDITNIEYPQESFDVIICNHVLEHVEDDIKAMSEMYRVLKNTGWAIILVPIANIKKTYEDKTITSEEGRFLAFGHITHARKYGKDYIDRLESVGFKVSKTSAKDIATKKEIERMSLQENSKIWGFVPTEIYYCTK